LQLPANIKAFGTSFSPRNRLSEQSV